MLKFVIRNTKNFRCKNEIIIFLILFIISSSIVIFQYSIWETSEERKKHQSLALFSGDEPFYLEIVSSIVRFHSINLDDSFTSTEKDPFFELPPLYYEVHSCRLHHSLTAADGHCYIQNIGLPLTLAPGYYIGGIVGSMLTLSFVFSLQGVIFYKISHHFTTKNLGLVLAILVSLATILLSLTSRIYPDFIGGFFLLTAFYLFFFREKFFLNISLVGLLLGFLPFLKLHFIVFPIILLPIMVFVLFKKHHYNNIFHLSASFSILLLIYFSIIIVIAPIEVASGVGGGYAKVFTKTLSSELFNTLSTSFQGSQNLLFGQTYGLFLFSPLALLSIFGIKYTWNYNKFLALSIIFLAFSFIFGLTLTTPWGGGWSLPSRYIIPILPILLIPLLPLFEKFKKNIIFHFIVLGCSYVGVSLNIIFARTIYGHLNLVEREDILNRVFFGAVNSFPHIKLDYDLPPPHALMTSGPIFLIFIIVLISFFVFFTFSSIIRKIFQMKNRKILFFVVLFGIYGSIFFYSYNSISQYYAESEIFNIFEEILKRQPTNEEMIYWKNSILNDKITSNEMRDSLVNSEEGLVTSKISEIYKEVLGRDVDNLGMIHWKEKILNKEILFQDIKNVIKSSEEALKLNNAN